VQFERLMFGYHFSVAQQLFDGRKQQWRPDGELLRNVPCPAQAFALADYVIGQAQCLASVASIQRPVIRNSTATW